MQHQISQIQATYNTLEDRIRLTIKTVDDQVYLAWITRRFASILLPILHGQHPISGESFFVDSEGVDALNKETQNQSMGNQAELDTKTPFEAPTDPHYPLGSTPILLTELSFKGFEEDVQYVVLSPEEGPGIQLPFSPEMLSALLKIITQALNIANWQLNDNFILQSPQQSRLQ